MQHTHHSAAPQQHLQGRVGSIVFLHPCIFSDNGEVLDVFRSKLLSYSVPLGSLVLLSLHSALGFTFCSCVSNAHSFQNWHYGFVFINGRNLGRYQDIGPQRTLYLPGPWLHPEDNEVSYLTLPQRCHKLLDGPFVPVFASSSANQAWLFSPPVFSPPRSSCLRR